MSVTASLPTPDAATVVARRHNSLETRQRWTVFGALAAGSLAMAIGFVAAGVWPVLPWSILELSALAAAFVAPLSTNVLNVVEGGMSASLFNGIAQGLPIKSAFDSTSSPINHWIMLRPDLAAPGHGLELRAHTRV